MEIERSHMIAPASVSIKWAVKESPSVIDHLTELSKLSMYLPQLHSTIHLPSWCFSKSLSEFVRNKATYLSQSVFRRHAKGQPSSWFAQTLIETQSNC